MLKKIILKIQKLEQQKQTKLDKLGLLQAEIDDIDMKLKKLLAFKRDYEKLENNSNEYLSKI